MAPRLRHVVEFVFLKIKATYQGVDRTVSGVQGHKGPFDFGQLGDEPLAFFVFNDSDHSAGSELGVGWCFVTESRLNGFQAIGGDFDEFAVLSHDTHFFRRRFNNDGCQQVALVALLQQRVSHGIFKFSAFVQRGQVNEALRTTVDLA